MLAEHRFITTLDGPDAIELAMDFLAGFHFTEVERDGRSLHARRGRPKAKETLSVSDLPQAVRLTFDRGQVELAVTVTEHRKVDGLHRQMALALIKGLEQTLAHDGDLEKARDWMESAERDNAAKFVKVRRRRRIILVGFAVFMCLLVGLVVWAMSSL